MKQELRISYLANTINLLVLSALLLNSCQTYHFADPQPVDTENIYEFPKNFRGTYTMDQDTIIFGKDYVKSSPPSAHEIINGIYVNPGDTIGYKKNDTTNGNMRQWRKHWEADKPFESLQSVKFDSLNNPIDTVVNYFIKRNKIYRISSDGLLEPGYPFKLKGDMIYYETPGIDIKLESRAFLRKISKDLYALNLREDTGWWTICILEKSSDGRLRLRYELRDNIEKMAIYSHHFHYYFDNQWTKQDILKLIDSGDFIDGGDFKELKPLDTPHN